LGQADLLSSEALLYENDQNTLSVRKEHTQAVLSIAKILIMVSEKEKSRASYFMEFGIKPLDALHLALAEKGKADYFCTCDDRLLRNARKITDLSLRVINPVDLAQEIDV
jgi:predicted nucleic acid-binding protein